MGSCFDTLLDCIVLCSTVILLAICSDKMTNEMADRVMEQADSLGSLYRRNWVGEHGNGESTIGISGTWSMLQVACMEAGLEMVDDFHIDNTSRERYVIY